MADEAIAIIGRTRMLVIDCSEPMSSCDRMTMTRKAAQILIDEPTIGVGVGEIKTTDGQ
jgi:hypothetical protein